MATRRFRYRDDRVRSTIGADISPRRDEIVERDAELRALALAQPADARRQPLKCDPLARQRDPAAQMLVVRKQLEHQVVGARDVLRIAGQRHPAKRSLPLAEERPDVLGNESRECRTRCATPASNATVRMLLP